MTSPPEELTQWDPFDRWGQLRAVAVEAATHAYVPYSRFPVGVAGLVEDGRIVRGANIENASYGLTLCAECAMICALHMSGGGRLTHVVCVDRDGRDLMPCGRCRQLLWEHGGPHCLVHTELGVWSMAKLLPQAFSDEDLRDR